jgi:hypothetical protein
VTQWIAECSVAALGIRNYTLARNFVKQGAKEGKGEDGAADLDVEKGSAGGVDDDEKIIEGKENKTLTEKRGQEEVKNVEKAEERQDRPTTGTTLVGH